MNTKRILLCTLFVIIIINLSSKSEPNIEGFVSTKDNYTAMYRRNKRKLFTNINSTFNRYTSGVYNFFTSKK